MTVSVTCFCSTVPPSHFSSSSLLWAKNLIELNNLLQTSQTSWISELSGTIPLSLKGKKCRNLSRSRHVMSSTWRATAFLAFAISCLCSSDIFIICSPSFLANSGFTNPTMVMRNRKDDHNQPPPRLRHPLHSSVTQPFIVATRILLLNLRYKTSVNWTLPNTRCLWLHLTCLQSYLWQSSSKASQEPEPPSEGQESSSLGFVRDCALFFDWRFCRPADPANKM